MAIKHMIGCIVAWYLVHIAATHLYAKLCVPFTLWGMATAPFMTAAPHCVMFRWAITNGGNTTMMGWGMITLWMTKFTFKQP